MLSSFPHLLIVASVGGLALASSVAAESISSKPKFTGSESCASSGCHGGGAGKDQFILWQKKDYHSRAHAILSATRSIRIGEALKIDDPSKSARCTVCHSPMESLPPDRIAKGVKADKGVSCENCHGAAEAWLRYHTRTDLSHEQRVAGGLRELQDFYYRSNSCVACHLNIDADLVKAGHPEMFFELDGQCAAQPPHWKDTGSWLGPRMWLTGQAVTLREMSWKLASKRDPDLLARWKALVWMIRRTDLGGRSVPESEDFAAVQRASDQLARSASRETWTKDSTVRLLRSCTSLANDFRDSKLEPVELRRRAELLVLAIDRMWKAVKVETGAASPNLDTALTILADQAKQQAAFERAKFAAALEQIEVAMVLGVKN